MWASCFHTVAVRLRGETEEDIYQRDGEDGYSLVEWDQENKGVWDVEAANRSMLEESQGSGLHRSNSLMLVQGLGLGSEDSKGMSEFNETDGAKQKEGKKTLEIDRTNDYIQDDEIVDTKNRKVPSKRAQRRTKLYAKRIEALWDDLSGEEDDFE
eukprot:CAMPEP_0201492436 /NCGR_PEP_ID=MMETSP0151_2-20130828/33080_1 /ASSEMBLY_ACC=CAM_ASM_000257 /TAXON_ID=200890 /ORGANISM="Paramoeba atlantica, Strain 621/1 / CCAP 1560/9" /LENGTH=154 /DNA_ID=CAMNT_0047879239 /DNA_START=81 /DNA_END=545 /DNA_ORIENTATION=-